MTPHFVMELTANVLCAVPNALFGEMTDGGTLTDLGVIVPQRPQNGFFVPTGAPGNGLEYDRENLARHAVS